MKFAIYKLMVDWRYIFLCPSAVLNIADQTFTTVKWWDTDVHLPWQELRFVMGKIGVEDTVRPDDWSISRGNLYDGDSPAHYPKQDA